MRRLFFALNQRLSDTTAHTLYCYRNAWWLAKTNPDYDVYLLFPGEFGSNHAKAIHLTPLTNFHIRPLPSLRKRRGKKGITINVIYYFSITLFLLFNSSSGDIVASASFNKLFKYLTGLTFLKTRVRFVYEVHQLAYLESDATDSDIQNEFKILKSANLLFTTTQHLKGLLERFVPGVPVQNIGLAATKPDAELVARNLRTSSLQIGYIGSLYHEQGVEWLIQSWHIVSREQSVTVHLQIIGGTDSDVQKLLRLAPPESRQLIQIRNAVPPTEIPLLIAKMDALIIPSLNEGRMPFVAVTKAYDYLHFGRPIIAASLPSITEVLVGEGSFLFAPGDVLSLSAAVNQCIQGLVTGKWKPDGLLEKARSLSWSQRNLRWWQSANSQPSNPEGVLNGN
jgi:glycosyltransferase involved in cell wall biosynthesis